MNVLEPNDARLVEAARAGDREAMERLLLALAERLLPLACALAGPGDPAEELVAETLGRVYERLDQLDAPEALFAWSRRILVRRYLDGRRFWQRRPQVRLETVELVDEGTFRYEDLDLRQAVDGLSRRDRAVLVLHYWQDLTLAECAGELGIPVGTVKSRLAAALERLRARLGGERDG